MYPNISTLFLGQNSEQYPIFFAHFSIQHFGEVTSPQVDWIVRLPFKAGSLWLLCSCSKEDGFIRKMDTDKVISAVCITCICICCELDNFMVDFALISLSWHWICWHLYKAGFSRFWKTWISDGYSKSRGMALHLSCLGKFFAFLSQLLTRLIYLLGENYCLEV